MASIISAKRLIVTPMKDMKVKKTQIHKDESAKNGFDLNDEPQKNNIDDISDNDSIVKRHDLEGALLKVQNKKNVFDVTNMKALAGRNCSNSKKKSVNTNESSVNLPN